jgi:hypothetical protein
MVLKSMITVPRSHVVDFRTEAAVRHHHFHDVWETPLNGLGR